MRSWKAHVRVQRGEISLVGAKNARLHPYPASKNWRGVKASGLDLLGS
jgi:hypothetical protein